MSMDRQDGHGVEQRPRVSEEKQPESEPGRARTVLVRALRLVACLALAWVFVFHPDLSEGRFMPGLPQHWRIALALGLGLVTGALILFVSWPAVRSRRESGDTSGWRMAGVIIVSAVVLAAVLACLLKVMGGI